MKRVPSNYPSTKLSNNSIPFPVSDLLVFSQSILQAIHIQIIQMFFGLVNQRMHSARGLKPSIKPILRGFMNLEHLLGQPLLCLGIFLTCLEISPVSFIRRKFPSLDFGWRFMTTRPAHFGFNNPTSLAFCRGLRRFIIPRVLGQGRCKLPVPLM